MRPKYIKEHFLNSSTSLSATNDLSKSAPAVVNEKPPLRENYLLQTPDDDDTDDEFENRPQTKTIENVCCQAKRTQPQQEFSPPPQSSAETFFGKNHKSNYNYYQPPRVYDTTIEEFASSKPTPPKSEPKSPQFELKTPTEVRKSDFPPWSQQYQPTIPVVHHPKPLFFSQPRALLLPTGTSMVNKITGTQFTYIGTTDNDKYWLTDIDGTVLIMGEPDDYDLA